MTNGLSEQLQIGKAGEHLVCADLILRGHSAFLSDAGLPYDLLVDSDSGLVRVQVKSTRKPYVYTRTKGGANSRQESYRFGARMGRNYRRMQAKYVDVVACVALDYKRIAYFGIGDLLEPDGRVQGLIEAIDSEKFKTFGKRTFANFSSYPPEPYDHSRRRCFHCDVEFPHTMQFFARNAKCVNGVSGICIGCTEVVSHKTYLRKVAKCLDPLTLSPATLHGNSLIDSPAPDVEPRNTTRA